MATLFATGSNIVAQASSARTIPSVWNPALQTSQPIMGYYTAMRDDAKCIFLLNNIVREKRVMKHLLAPRPVGVWNQEKIKAQADSIRSSYPYEARLVIVPKRWEDLWEYFDTHDLYFAGAWNLWRVIELLAQQNAIATYDPDMAHEIVDWAFKWLGRSQNRQKLARWDTRIDILSIFNPEDWQNISTTEPVVMTILGLELKYWYDYFCKNGFDVNDAGYPAITDMFEFQHHHTAMSPVLSVEYPARCSSAIPASPVQDCGKLQHEQAQTGQHMSVFHSSGKGPASHAGSSRSSSSSSRTLSGWIAMGVDPVHGPILLRTTGANEEKKGQTGSTPDTECKNKDRRSPGSQNLGGASFAACTCKKCERCSRSILITAHDAQGKRQKILLKDLEMLREYLGQWGQVESSWFGKSRCCFICFKNDVSAKMAVEKGAAMPSVNNNLEVSVVHPYFSKYYQPNRKYSGSRGNNQMASQPVPYGTATPHSGGHQIASAIQSPGQNGVYYHSYGPAQHYHSTTESEQGGQPSQYSPVYSYDGGATQLGDREDTGTVIRREVQTRGRLPSEWESAGTSSAASAEVPVLSPACATAAVPVPAAPVSPVAEKTGGSTHLPAAQAEPKPKNKGKGKSKKSAMRATTAASPAVDPSSAPSIIEMEPKAEKTAEQKGKSKATDAGSEPDHLARPGGHRATGGGSLKVPRTRNKKAQPAEKVVPPAEIEPEPGSDSKQIVIKEEAEPSVVVSPVPVIDTSATTESGTLPASAAEEHRAPAAMPGWPRGFFPYPYPMQSIPFRVSTGISEAAPVVRKDNNTLGISDGGGKRSSVSHSAHSSLHSTSTESFLSVCQTAEQSRACSPVAPPAAEAAATTPSSGD